MVNGFVNLPKGFTVVIVVVDVITELLECLDDVLEFLVVVRFHNACLFWLHTTICNIRAKLKFCGAKTVPDEFPGHQIEDAEREATQEVLAILVGLTDGGEFNWSEAISNPVIHDDSTWNGFHSLLLLIR